jgi:hypothetical protein
MAAMPRALEASDPPRLSALPIDKLQGLPTGASCDSSRGVNMRIQPGIYRHYKGPEYRVFGVARHSETEEQMVFYQALYGDYGLWVRPLSMFLESVEVDGERVPRFSLIQAEHNQFMRSGEDAV